ncbi:MAG: right-handed parallel beta-helix repeat-containing protein [Thiobacillus sp.]
MRDRWLTLLRHALLLGVLLPGVVQAAMFGYVTNANGIYRLNTTTGATTLQYNGAPFDGATSVVADAMRPSDGMIFFLFTNVANQSVYRWDPATPATAPVLIGNTGVARILRLAFHPSNGNLYGTDNNPSTALWTINLSTGAASSAATISGLPVDTSGDIAFNPVTGNLYAPIQPTGATTATVYLIPLAGGAVSTVGTITGLPNSGTSRLNSAMFNAAGTLFIGGDGTNLFTGPINGGAVTTVGNMGITPQDFASAPTPPPTVGKSFSPITIGVNSTSVLTLTLTNPYANPLRGAAITDTYPAGVVNSATPAASTTCGGTASATAGANTLALTGGTIPANGSCTVTVTVTSAAAGSYNNTLAAGDLTTILASNDNAANATLTVITMSLSGRVYEDINYGGGSGRSQAASSGVAVANARVELFNSAGNFVTFATTNATGDYTFAGLNAGNYTVRVVNSSVRSTRTGGAACATCLPIQTWRTDAASGSAVAMTDRVGGESPQLVDAGNGSTTLAALTTVTTTAQSITAATLANSNLGGLDFGYNFDTIVNTTNTGQGSLRQFIDNANTLGGDAALAQSGSRVNLTTGASSALPAAVETSIFMIPDGLAHPGLRAGLINQLTVGRALIGVTTALPAVSTTMAIDGGTQTFNIGNTNNVSLGTGGTVGVGAVALPTLNGPEVELRDGPTGATGLAIGLDLTASNTIVRGLAIVGFGGTADSDTNAAIRLPTAATGIILESNVLGTTAVSFSNPGATLRGTGDLIRNRGSDTGFIRNNLIGFSNGNGISFDINSSTGWAISGNEIRGNAIGSTARNGIEFVGAPSNTISGNLITAHRGAGIDLSADTADTNALTQNTISGNGEAAGTEPAGIRVASGDSNPISLNIISSNTGPGIEILTGSNGNTVSQNRIQSNTQSGIEIDNGAATNTLTQNSIFGNTRIGIDLLAAAAPVAPYYTQNDNGDGDAGGNALLNFPQITTAAISGGNLIVSGIAPAGATIELFISDNDATGFGEGQTYLVTLTEGSGSDSAAGTSANTVSCGVGAVSITMNNFAFSIPIPGGVVSGTSLTTTATVGSNTSEFSCNATVVQPSLTFMKTVAVTSDPFNGGTNPKNIPGAEVLYTLNVMNSGNGPLDSNSLSIVDPIPTNTELFTGNLSGGAPFQFTDSVAPVSGVACAFIALNNLTDCIDFSNDGGISWSYVPNGGYDPAVTHLRFRPTGILNADPVAGAPSPNFNLGFRVRIK